jgi:hypothetical protein
MTDEQLTTVRSLYLRYPGPYKLHFECAKEEMQSIVDRTNAVPDLLLHIDAQAARIAELEAYRDDLYKQFRRREAELIAQRDHAREWATWWADWGGVHDDPDLPEQASDGWEVTPS